MRYIIGIFVVFALIFFARACRNAGRLSKSGSGLSFFSRNPGEVGEYNVAWQLSRLDGAQYFVINDLLFRRSNGCTVQIDHIVVSPYGVFVIETKNISGYIYGSENAQQWLRRWKGYSSGGFYTENELSFDNPIKQNLIHIDSLSERLGVGLQIPYYSIIAFSPDATLKVKTDKSNVIYWSEIRSYIRQYDKAIMSVEDAKNIYENIIALNIKNPEVRSQHAESARARKINHKIQTINAINIGKCPECGGNLIQREGAYGRFYGCSNYPKCKYTHPAN